MSISERTLSPRRGQSSWLAPRTKQKQILFLAELSIFVGLILLGYGIFTSELAFAGSADGVESDFLSVQNSVDFVLIPPVSELRQTEITLELEDVQLIERGIGAAINNEVPNDLAKIPAEFESKVESSPLISFEGGRVKAGYLLPTTKVEWFESPFIISHYTFALETDPKYADDKKIPVPGLPENVKLREGFVFGGRGIIQQGTGVTEDGDFISIDWTKSHYDEEDVSQNRWFFRYGQGRPVEAWKTVAVRHPDLPPGTRIVIQNYHTIQEFVVGDAGLDLAENQIDIFVGPVTIEEADKLGVQRSRVGIIRPISYFVPEDETESEAAEE